MGYLYGDLSPFPPNANYVDLIRDLTELCHTLLRIDAAIDGYRRQTERENDSVQRTLGEFKQIAKDLAETLQPHVTRTDNPVVKDVCGRLVQAVRGVLESAQNTLMSRRESNAAEAESRARTERGLAMPALEKFLLSHELPNTAWTLVWSAGQAETSQAEARGTALTPFGLQTSFRLEIPPDAPWGRVVRVSEIKQNVALNLPVKGRRGTTKRSFDLDRYHITQFEREQQGARLVLRKTTKPSAPGFELRWQGEDLSVAGVDDPSFPAGAVTLEAYDASVAAGLRDTVESHLRPLVRSRVRLLDAKLNDTDVADLKSPAPLARSLIKVVAPYAREIVSRSPVRGELTLKRVVEDGRREEVFISIADVAKIYAPLSADRRAYFDELGLAAESAPGPELELEAAPAPEPRIAPLKREDRDSPVPLPRTEGNYIDSVDAIELTDYDDADEITKRSSTTDEDGLLHSFIKPHDDD
jgi:hypothetical protein